MNKTNLFRQPSGDVCRLCQNTPNKESLRSSILNQNVSILKNNLTHLIHNRNKNKKFNFEFFQGGDSENKIIQPCNCLIPVHSNCLLKLILFTQNLSCPGCNSIINLKRTKKKNFSKKCLSLKFIPQNFFYLILILFFLCCILVSSYIEFQNKFIHVKVILLIFLVLFEILFLMKYFKFLKKLGNFPLTEKLVFKEKKFENEINSDSQVVIPLTQTNGNKPLLKNWNSNKQINSLRIFDVFLKVYFGVSSMEILEYKNERNKKNKIDHHVKSSLLNIISLYNKEKSANIHVNINKEFNSYLNFFNANDLNLKSNRDSKNESERGKFEGTPCLLLKENIINTNVSQINNEKYAANLQNVVNPSLVHSSNILNIPAIANTTPKNSDRTLKNKNWSVNADNNVPTYSAKSSNQNFAYEKKSEIENENFKENDNHIVIYPHNQDFPFEKSINNNDNIHQNSVFLCNQNIGEHKSLVMASNHKLDQLIPSNPSNEYQINSHNIIVPYPQSDDESQINLQKQILQMKYTNLSLKKIEELDSMLYYPDEEKSRLTNKHNNIHKIFSSMSRKELTNNLQSTQSPLKNFLKSSLNNKSTINNISNINNFLDDNFTQQYEPNNGRTFLRGLSELVKDGNIINDDISQNSNKNQYKNTISQFSVRADSNLRGSFLTNSNNIFDNGTSSSEVDKFSTQILKNSDFLVNLDSPKRKNLRHITYNYHKNHDYMSNFSIVQKNKLKKKRINNSKGKTETSHSKFSNSLISNSEKNKYDIDHFYKKITEKEKNTEEDHLSVSKDLRINTVD